MIIIVYIKLEILIENLKENILMKEKKGEKNIEEKRAKSNYLFFKNFNLTKIVSIKHESGNI